MKNIVLVFLITAFLIFTAYVSATAELGILEELSIILSNVSTLSFHMLVDLYLLVFLFSCWMIRDARGLGNSWVVILLFTFFVWTTVSIGVIAYLLYRSKSATVDQD